MAAPVIPSSEDSKAVEHLVRARLVVDDKIARDRMPDLQNYFTSGFSSTQEERLDVAAGTSLPRESWEVEDMLNFPAGLQDEIERWRKGDYQFCFEGILPEISHAWVTLDNRLFLWNYRDDGQEWTVFDELDQVIISVALVKPKRKVFVETVQHLLVVATPVEVILLAVVVRDNGSINLLSTHLSIPSDNTQMLKVKGTRTGRVFMCGRDGNLFELHYQAEDSWFRRKVRKVNHTQTLISSFIPSFLKITTEDPIIDVAMDDERNLLYTLSDKSRITVYDLGSDGETFTVVASVSNVKKGAERLWYEARSLQAKTFDVVSIAVVPPTSSAAVHLVAITVSGIRLYYTTIPRRSINYVLSSSTDTAGGFRRFGPAVLELLHVRLPPSRSKEEDRSMWLAYKVTEAFYTNGACVLADVVDGKDALICTAPDNAAIGKQKKDKLYEQTAILASIKGSPRFICNADVHRDDLQRRSELSTQHVLPRLRLLCLSDQGLHMVSKDRPVDVLRKILRQGPQDGKELDGFFQLYGQEQACSCCLVLACASLQLDLPPVQSSLLNAAACMDRANQGVGQLAAEAFFAKGGAAKSSGGFEWGRPNGGAAQVQFSGKVHGLALYLSRCLQLVWNEPFVRMTLLQEPPAVGKEEKAAAKKIAEKNAAEESKAKSGDAKGTACALAPPLHPSQMDQLQDLLVRLHDFLQACPQFAPEVLSVPEHTADPQQIEERTVYSLHLLLKRSIQALAFVQIVCDSSQRVTSSARFYLPTDSLKAHQSLKFGDLVCTEAGVVASKQLVTALIDYHTLTGNVGSISATLEQECPLFFSGTDRVQFRAFERLRKAARLPRPQAQAALVESLRDFKSIARSLDILPVFEEYRRQRFYTGTLDLLLTCAAAVGPNNAASTWFPDGHGKVAPALQQLYAHRSKYYDLMLQTLTETIEYSNELLTADATLAPGQEANHPGFKLRLEALHTILRANDELAHRALFGWFVENEAVNELLQVHSPYLEAYLKDVLGDAYTLYRYYVVTNRHAEATRLAYSLALAPANGLGLRERLEYLARAIASSKECPGSAEVNAADLDDMMEVAHIQMKLLEQLSGQAAGEEAREAAALLDAELHDLSELYRIASRHRLWELILEILHSAKSNYPRARARVRAVECWTHIVDEEATSSSAASSSSPFQRSSALAYKITAVGRQFHPSDWAFPVEDIVRIVEEAARPARSASADVAWLARLLHDQARVSYAALLGIYAGLVEHYQKVNAAQDVQHCIRIAIELVRAWLDSTDPAEVRQRSAVAADRLDNFIFALNGDLSSSRAVATLLAELKELRTQV